MTHSILNYPETPNRKTRALKRLGGEEEAAIYDLIFNDRPLRQVAAKTNLSYQGVYIRALAYMKYWAKLGELAIRPEYVVYLHTLYGENSKGEADETEAMK